ncbi:hypothetical protein Gotur_018769 [Gossypium turneri]
MAKDRIENLLMNSPVSEGTPGNRSSGDEVGPVTQRIRVRGYEPRCRGFESLLAHNRPKREGPFPLGEENHDRDSGPKAMELGRGSFAEMETASLRHLLVLVHLRILNWLVVNSPKTMEQRIIPDTYTKVLTVILKYRRIECDTMR